MGPFSESRRKVQPEDKICAGVTPECLNREGLWRPQSVSNNMDITDTCGVQSEIFIQGQMSKTSNRTPDEKAKKTLDDGAQ